MRSTSLCRSALFGTDSSAGVAFGAPLHCDVESDELQPWSSISPSSSRRVQKRWLESLGRRSFVTPSATFHAIYGENEATFSIETLEMPEGRLPRRVMALVLEWAMSHRPELRENWRRAGLREPLIAVSGLDEES